MHFGPQAAGNNRVEFNLFNGSWFIHPVSFSLQWPGSLCNLHSSSFSLCLLPNSFSPLIHSFLTLSLFSLSLPPESCQYDIHHSKGEPGTLCAPCGLWPSPGGQSQSICDYSSTVSAHRHGSHSDEAYLLWLAWRTGTQIVIMLTPEGHKWKVLLKSFIDLYFMQN